MISRSKPLLVLAGCIFSTFFLVSCGNERVVDAYVPIPGGVWEKDEKVELEVDISDTISSHNLFLNLRNTGQYRYSNIFVFMETHFPDGTYIRDTIECPLADETGKWYGSGWGSIFDNQVEITNQILFKRKADFSQSGKYKFVFQQGMREEELANIIDVGLRIEKS